jgi:hypothetical protein
MGAAGMTCMLPLDRNRSSAPVPEENVDDKREHDAFVYVVAPGYLETMNRRRPRRRRSGDGAPDGQLSPTCRP